MTRGRASNGPAAGGAVRDLRSYGRRRGRKLSARQETLLRDVLPELELDLSVVPPSDLSDLFAKPVTEIWLEIGFGGGEHLLWQAAHNPGAGILGCEPFQDGVLKVLDRIGASRIRLSTDDVRPLLRWLPPASISRAFVLFPDPWPKLRHRKRRLVTPALLGMLARVMPAGAELRIASDVGDYVGAILRAVQEQGAFRWTAMGPRDWRERPPDWPPTRYETKAVAASRRCYYLTFLRLQQS